MSMPPWRSPATQAVADRSLAGARSLAQEHARHEHAVLRRAGAGDEGPRRLRGKGIARGRALVALRYAEGVAIVAENSSETLRKVSEIYDRIAFAGVGKYNEFDQLRVAGVRAADLKGFQYSRDDVDARSLANQYAQILGQIFTHEMKPMEVEILVAEVGVTPDSDQMFHILYDGTVFDQRDYTVLGGDADAITTRMAESFAEGLDVAAAVRAGAAALSGPERTLPATELEVAVLARGTGRRCFRRLSDETVAGFLGG